MKKSISRLFIIVIIVSVTVFIQSCKSSLFGYITIEGSVYYFCSGNPVVNEEVNLIKYGVKGSKEFTQTNSAGYFKFRTLRTGDGVEGWRVGVKNAGIVGCNPGCSEDMNIRKYILPIQPFPVLKFRFVIDSQYNSSTSFSWTTDSIDYDTKFKNGILKGPFYSPVIINFIDSASFNSILLDKSQIQNEISTRKIYVKFKNKTNVQSFSFGYCSVDTIKVTINPLCI